jgi:D-tagatose-1,6-bisphosphate aldolase subunit GatZ/KbaZ
VIGSEVPPPGGATEDVYDVAPTQVADAEETIAVTRDAFRERGLEEAWERVIAVVVQPGVEFSDLSVVEYDRTKAEPLSRHIEQYGGLVYEAHSTDYQRRNALRRMVEDHFAILKVGPALTFAFREAVFALSTMEDEWLGGRRSIVTSDLREVLDRAMVGCPEHWQNHHSGGEAELRYARRYSYSDRSRYYWAVPEVRDALRQLIGNLEAHPIPLTLLSQYMPAQYAAVREGEFDNNPRDLIYSKVTEVLADYASACDPSLQE